MLAVSAVHALTMNRLEEIAPLIGDSNEDNGDELSSDSHSSLVSGASMVS